MRQAQFLIKIKVFNLIYFIYRFFCKNTILKFFYALFFDEFKNLKFNRKSEN